MTIVHCFPIFCCSTMTSAHTEAKRIINLVALQAPGGFHAVWRALRPGHGSRCTTMVELEFRSSDVETQHDTSPWKLWELWEPYEYEAGLEPQALLLVFTLLTNLQASVGSLGLDTTTQLLSLVKPFTLIGLPLNHSEAAEGNLNPGDKYLVTHSRKLRDLTHIVHLDLKSLLWKNRIRYKLYLIVFFTI